MTIYHIDYNILYHTYNLTAYEVVKETPKQYKVKNGKAIIGHSSWRNVLDKSDPKVLTSFDTAVECLVLTIKRFIDDNNNANWQMENNIQFLNKLSEDNWRDVVGK